MDTPILTERMNHVSWLNRYFNIIAQLVCGSQNYLKEGEYSYSEAIVKFSDKGDTILWKKMELDRNHGICLFILGLFNFHDKVEKDRNGKWKNGGLPEWFEFAVNVKVCGNWNVLDLIRWIELQNPYFVGSLGEVRDIHSHVGKCLYHGKITRYLVMGDKLMYEVMPDVKDPKYTTMYFELGTDRTLSKQHSFYCGM